MVFFGLGGYFLIDLHQTVVFLGPVHNLYGHNPVRAIFDVSMTQVDSINQWVVDGFDPGPVTLTETFGYC